MARSRATLKLKGSIMGNYVLRLGYRPTYAGGLILAEYEIEASSQAVARRRANVMLSELLHDSVDAEVRHHLGAMQSRWSVWGRAATTTKFSYLESGVHRHCHGHRFSAVLIRKDRLSGIQHPARVVRG